MNTQLCPGCGRVMAGANLFCKHCGFAVSVSRHFRWADFY